ncbi:NUDIX hydrolase [Herbidospora galbida]|uniref:NUDIX hydrolase n=1 Tax=Herbidospora galbida TaxID=2575442 RepID=A0A4U3M8A2_9ACTN|nr:NUDIX domain-containing protein [Herbidospora galbida]TKK85228.1 NUDIX hydrolase [Herbidospora galbida]
MTVTRLPRPSIRVTADLVILTVRSGELHVLLIDRGNPPYLGRPALPGGFVRDGETLEGAAYRELAEETGLLAGDITLEQLRAYSEPGRDPRGRVITIAYLALGPELPLPVAGTDAAAARWIPVEQALATELAFDHEEILRDCLESARARLEHTTAAATFCKEPFTVADLRHVYEAVWGQRLDPSNFRRKVTNTAGFIVPTGERRFPDVGRPAALYTRGPATLLIPPLLRTTTDEP